MLVGQQRRRCACGCPPVGPALSAALPARPPRLQAQQLCDFLLPMLHFDPAKRASAADMLRHPWLQQEQHVPLRRAMEAAARGAHPSPARCASRPRSGPPALACCPCLPTQLPSRVLTCRDLTTAASAHSPPPTPPCRSPSLTPAPGYQHHSPLERSGAAH